MYKSSLIEILRTFDKQEMLRLEDLVSSPYFNKKSNVLKLFLEIRKYYPEFTDANVEKEKIWKSLFPKKDFNYGIMKNLIHDLHKLAIRFIELENYSVKKFDSEINILEQYFSRNLPKSYGKKRDDLKSYMSKEKPSADLYSREFIIGRKDMEYLYANYTLKNIKDFDFSPIYKSLVFNFFSNFFLLNANIYTCQIHFKISSEQDFLEMVMDLYSGSDLKNYYTDIFYYILKISRDQRDVSDYLKLKELCFANFDKLNRADRRTVLESLILYCIHKTNSGDQSFYKDRYQYHKMMDEHDLLLNDNNKEIEGYQFVNTNVAACSSGEYEWAEDFVNRYKSKLPAGEGRRFVNLAYTHLYFKKGEFEKALTYLSKCDNAYGMDKINIKTYEAFLYFELKYYEELKNLVDTSKRFINNDKMISDEIKVLYRKFIEAVNMLNEYRYKSENENDDTFELQEIRKYIAENNMPHKGWLLSKITQLENNRA